MRHLTKSALPALLALGLAGSLAADGDIEAVIRNAKRPVGTADAGADPVAKAGKHKGEAKQMDADVVFAGSSGVTVTDAKGITYNFWGLSLHEDKVYPAKYWGSFPLYFFGAPVTAAVTVSNNGPRESLKVRVTTQAYSLNTDGSNGVRLAPDGVQEVVLAKGETRTLDMSFTPQFVPGADSGLDRVVLLVQHVNEGGNGAGNAYPALILSKEAILCPPAIQAAAKR